MNECKHELLEGAVFCLVCWQRIVLEWFEEAAKGK